MIGVHTVPHTRCHRHAYLVSCMQLHNTLTLTVYTNVCCIDVVNYKVPCNAGGLLLLMPPCQNGKAHVHVYDRLYD